jgi:hypothetical protein
MGNERLQAAAAAAAQAANNEAIRQLDEYEAQETNALINYLERRLDFELTGEEKNKLRNPAFAYLRYELNRVKNDLSMVMSNFYPGPQGEQISIIPMYQDQVRNLINDWNENRERQAQAQFNEGNAMLELYNQYGDRNGGKRRTRKLRKTHRRRHAKKSRRQRY